MRLSAMTPRNALISTAYCLAQPGSEYLVYQPASGAAFTVTLGAGIYAYEWFNPSSGKAAGTGTFVAGAGPRSYGPLQRGRGPLPRCSWRRSTLPLAGRPRSCSPCSS